MFGFQGKASRLLFFFFVFSFFVLFYLEDFIGLLLRVTQTYYRSSTDLRPALQSEKRYIASQPIETNLRAVCELAKGGCSRLNTLELQATKNTIKHGIVLTLR